AYAPALRQDSHRTASRCRKPTRTAVQISGHIIDIASPAAESGKTPGTDLREGIHTLPMLYALTENGPGVDRLRILLSGPLTDENLITDALFLLRESPALDRTTRTLPSYTDAARTEMADLPPCPARDALSSVTDYLAARTT